MKMSIGKLKSMMGVGAKHAEPEGDDKPAKGGGKVRRGVMKRGC